MGTLYEFVVRSEPRPQPRPKAARIAGRIRIYTPGTASLYKAAVQSAAKEAINFGSTPIDSPVELSGEFVMRRPKRLRKSAVDEVHICKPDLDNLIKSTQDAIVDAGILRDDCLIFSVNMTKRYANEGEAPHTRIAILVA
mgnify:CR=1 FL=1